MATETYGSIGQAAIVATAPPGTAVITVPGGGLEVRCSTLIVCNVSGAQRLFSLYHAINNAAYADKQMLYNQVVIPATGKSFAATLLFGGGDTDVFYGYADAAGLSVNAYGVTVTP